MTTALSIAHSPDWPYWDGAKIANFRPKAARFSYRNLTHSRATLLILLRALVMVRDSPQCATTGAYERSSRRIESHRVFCYLVLVLSNDQ